jgi:hypothetical protein
MKKLFPAIVISSLLLAGCQTGGQYTAEELKEWHAQLKSSNSQFITPLYYTGTDETSHHFICRSMDVWVPIEVPKYEITIEDVRPYQTSSLQNSTAYYIVNPEDNFSKTTK